VGDGLERCGDRGGGVTLKWAGRPGLAVADAVGEPGDLRGK
jgi:hypothetical protein